MAVFKCKECGNEKEGR